MSKSFASRSMFHASFIAILTSALLPLGLAASHTPDPTSVTIAGSLQDELGCPGDWQPDCAATHLVFDAEDTAWQGVFNVPAGDWEYKAALNDSWDENYGVNATPNGPNIGLSLADATDVKFYYSHETHWVTDNFNSVIAVAVGSFQEELGCSGDWQPWCLRSWLQDPDGDGIFTFRTRALPAGDYEVKVAIDESWDENYGDGGVPGGANIPFTVASDCEELVFEFDWATKILTVGATSAAPQPASVTIAGSLQSELGCPGDWQPDCATTYLGFDSEDMVWQSVFNVPAGDWEYKAALNDSWDVNYGDNATQDGPNIGLSLVEATDVKFYYPHDTHWITDNQGSRIATAPGSYQSEIGCSGDWDPSCLRSWLQDPDGDGIFTFSTWLPAGSYEVKAAINESWDENYGDGGVPGGANIPFTVPQSCTEVFFTFVSSTNVLTIGAEGGPVGNLNLAKAHWVTEDTIAWNAGSGGDVFDLHYAEYGGLGLDETGVTGAEVTLPLTWSAGLPSDVLEKFPHLAGYDALRLDPLDLGQVPTLLKGQVAVSVAASDDTPIDATGLQIPGVLDDLYTYSGELGVAWDSGQPTIRVWAPTARSVTLHLFADSEPATTSTTYPMVLDGASGMWSVMGEMGWRNQFYLFEVEVYVHASGQVEHNLVTDPYSLGLAMNSTRSQIVDLDDLMLEPMDWDILQKPPLAAPEDISIYEIHVRDFSAQDPSVPEELKGTYKAFTLEDTYGNDHLEALQDAGLTHLHLLPAFDIATINENRAEWQAPDPAQLATYPPDSDQQQAEVTLYEDLDGFNWGYDPFHYTVPEGSYATDPDGSTRIVEFREMVQALNESGLRVVMDVVYNHTNAAGQNPKSVLDRIVPGYYHRLDDSGAIETSSCCPNTASEHDMMEKLMIDSLVTWATEYKIDAFRFDLMGHHMKRNMENVRAALDALTLEEDGVDGSSIYIYGEGWNFGEVADNARGENATQLNMGGTGIGTFSDRLRDAVRGGGPFDGGQDLIRRQGFANGLFYDPNALNSGSTAELDTLLLLSDQIRVGMAGNLAAYEFIDRNGNLVTGADVDYNGQPTGYTQDPQEVIAYISKHDNQTLYDNNVYKAPVATSMADRLRIQNVGLSTVVLGQGVPFMHAGSDLLRSKSLDRDSFNSGDWFNKLDFTYQANNFGVGLPVASKNQDNWAIMAPLLANPALQPASSGIQDMAERLQELLEIRYSTELFRLETAEEIQDRVAYHNTGPSQAPGLIVMSVLDDEGSIDRTTEIVFALFNANDDDVSFLVPAAGGLDLRLHPVQAGSSDPIVGLSAFDIATGAFSVPGRTTAVFVGQRSASEQIDLLIDDVEELIAAGVLNRGQGNALLSKLWNIRRKIARGKINAALGQLGAFVNQVEGFVRAGILTEEQGAVLIAAAQDIEAALMN